MHKTLTALALSMAFSLPVFAGEIPDSIHAAQDTRAVVAIPAADLAALKTHMRHWQKSLGEALKAWADGDIAKADKLIFMGTGNGDIIINGLPSAGKHVPPEMRALSKSMRDASRRFELAAAIPDARGMMNAYTEIQNACTACHQAYRVEAK